MDKHNPTNQQKREAYIQGITEEIEILYKEVDFRTRRIKILLKELEAIL